MILRSFYLILLTLCIKSIYCHNFTYGYSNISKNNDLQELRKSVLQNKKVFIFGEEWIISQNITSQQIKHVVGEFGRSQNKETVKHFYLFTRDNHNGLMSEILKPLNESTIKNSSFKARQTYIIIHGFLGFGMEEWILTIKDKLLRIEDCNVISVDWPAGSVWFLPSYLSASSRVSAIGKDTAIMIQSLMDHKGLLLESVHCIGHSLGAHVCGFAGKPFMGRIGRISGLDPAGPRFHHLNSSYRLDKSDAVYVDVMHTNACNKPFFELNCFGLSENIGHSNFFPNGGKHQPACTTSHKGLTGSIGCDHEMAYIYYIASLEYDESSTYFLSRPCEDWIEYEKGNCSCGSSLQYMGFNVNTELNGLFYLETLAYPSFAKQDNGCLLLRSNAAVVSYVIVIQLIFISIILFTIFIFMKIRRCYLVKRNEEQSVLI